MLFRSAFPSISTGVYHFPLEKAAQIAISAILDELLRTDFEMEVRMVCFDEKTKAAYDPALCIQLITRLINLCRLENWKQIGGDAERTYIKLINDIAINVGKWQDLGSYRDYIERSDKAIDDNIESSESLDLNTCIATLICVYREQNWNGGWSDIITPRVISGGLLRLSNRLLTVCNQSGN